MFGSERITVNTQITKRSVRLHGTETVQDKLDTLA